MLPSLQNEKVERECEAEIGNEGEWMRRVDRERRQNREHRARGNGPAASYVHAG